MDFLLLAATFTIRDFNRDSLVSLPSVRTSIEYGWDQGRRPNEARVRRSGVGALTIGRGRRRVRDVDVQRQGAVFETTRTERSLSAKKRESETNRIRMRVEKEGMGRRERSVSNEKWGNRVNGLIG